MYVVVGENESGLHGASSGVRFRELLRYGASCSDDVITVYSHEIAAIYYIFCFVRDVR